MSGKNLCKFNLFLKRGRKTYDQFQPITKDFHNKIKILKNFSKTYELIKTKKLLNFTFQLLLILNFIFILFLKETFEKQCFLYKNVILAFDFI